MPLFDWLIKAWVESLRIVKNSALTQNCIETDSDIPCRRY